HTFSFSPHVQVRATDLVGIPSGASVIVDVVLPNTSNWMLNFVNPPPTLVNGAVDFPVPIGATGIINIRTHVTDLAGNIGDSNVVSISIDSDAIPWGPARGGTNGVVTMDMADGQVMQQMGGLRLTHALDLDRSPGSGQSGNPALVYNSDLTNVR